jgi:hypothetical protein
MQQQQTITLHCLFSYFSPDASTRCIVQTKTRVITCITAVYLSNMGYRSNSRSVETLLNKKDKKSIPIVKIVAFTKQKSTYRTHLNAGLANMSLRCSRRKLSIRYSTIGNHLTNMILRRLGGFLTMHPPRRGLNPTRAL